MLTEQNKESVLRPFRTLKEQCISELAKARVALGEWEKARSISASGDIPDNVELGDKILQLEKVSGTIETFILNLTPQLNSDVDFEEIVQGQKSSYVDLNLVFNEAKSLLDYRYTLVQKNKINSRITAINSSGMLSNADMQSIQNLWTDILTMKNDRNLVASKKMFEGRLNDWENVIAQKR